MSRRVLFDSRVPLICTTWTLLSAQLLASAVGRMAFLFGPTGDLVGVWRKVGASSLRLVSDLWPQYANNAILPVGAPGSGAPLIYLGATNPATWATPGASGGLILDGTGPLSLPCIGQLSGRGSIDVAALCFPTVTSAADGQAILAGTASNGRTDGIRGGARRASGVWLSAWSVGNPTSPTTGGTATAEYARTIATGRELLLIHQQSPCDSTNQRGAYVAGCFSGDETGTSDTQQSSTGSTSARVGDTDHEVTLNVIKAAGTLSARFTRISALNLARVAGVGA